MSSWFRFLNFFWHDVWVIVSTLLFCEMTESHPYIPLFHYRYWDTLRFCSPVLTFVDLSVKPLCITLQLTILQYYFKANQSDFLHGHHVSSGFTWTLFADEGSGHGKSRCCIVGNWTFTIQEASSVLNWSFKSCPRFWPWWWWTYNWTLCPNAVCVHTEQRPEECESCPSYHTSACDRCVYCFVEHTVCYNDLLRLLVLTE